MRQSHCKIYATELNDKIHEATVTNTQLTAEELKDKILESLKLNN
tara:strand:- start:24 stop:158 length:135 start_codon:yes stop_codon:yes gene_type:complete